MPHGCCGGYSHIKQVRYLWKIKRVAALGFSLWKLEKPLKKWPSRTRHQPDTSQAFDRTGREPWAVWTSPCQHFINSWFESAACPSTLKTYACSWNQRQHKTNPGGSSAGNGQDSLRLGGCQVLEKLPVASHQKAKAVTKGSQLKAALPGEYLPKCMSCMPCALCCCARYPANHLRSTKGENLLSHTFEGRTTTGKTLLAQKRIALYPMTLFFSPRTCWMQLESKRKHGFQVSEWAAMFNFNLGKNTIPKSRKSTIRIQ